MIPVTSLGPCYLLGVEERRLPEEALHVARAADALVHRHLAEHLSEWYGSSGVGVWVGVRLR